jgi:hypothetical protein
MTHKINSFRPSPALAIACLALFMALTGSAFAVGIAKNSVRSAQIADGTLRSIDLRDNAVNSPKIAPNAVGSEEIAENAVESPEVAPDALTAEDLGAASVTSSEVADQSLTSNDLGPNSVGSSELRAGSIRAEELGPIIQVSNSTTIKGGDNVSVGVACPVGTTAISGGASSGFYQVHLASSYRSGNGWHVDARSGAVGDTTITAFAYCLTGGSSN